MQHTKRLAAGSLVVFLFFFGTDLPTFGFKHFIFLRDKRSEGVKILIGGCQVASLVSSSSELVIAGYTTQQT